MVIMGEKLIWFFK